jgi:hypothetical protein
MMAEAPGQPPEDRHGLSAFCRHSGNGRPPHNSTSAVFTDRLQQISIPANTSSDVPSITERGLGCPQYLADARSHSSTQKQHDISGIHREAFLFPLIASDCAKFPPTGILAAHIPLCLVASSLLRKFAFVIAAEHEYKDLPPDVQDEFRKDLRRIQYCQNPERPIKSSMESVGVGAIGLIIWDPIDCCYATGRLLLKTGRGAALRRGQPIA